MGRFTAFVFIIILFPVFILISAIIKTESRGSVFYVQPRCGKDRKLFNIYKFRSMSDNGNPTLLTMENDKRLTRSGKTLRRYKLDELPQLLNILKGDMAWFGPRPEQAYFTELILKKNRSLSSLYAVKPGLLSLGAVEYGYATNPSEMEERARYDKYYLQHRTLKLRLYILTNTFRLIMKGNNR